MNNTDFTYRPDEAFALDREVAAVLNPLIGKSSLETMTNLLSYQTSLSLIVNQQLLEGVLDEESLTCVMQVLTSALNYETRHLKYGFKKAGA